MVIVNDALRMLVADVGGTNARFGIAAIEKGAIRIENEQSCLCVKFTSFEAALAYYLEQIDSVPLIACIAVAGPVVDKAIKMTNISWAFSVSGLQAQFGFSHVELINDFAAQACAIPVLPSESVLLIKEGQTLTQSVKGVLGPGTGLGVASLVCSHDAWLPVSGEGGHVSLPVSNQFETELFTCLMKQNQLQYVPAETVLCGSGLVTLYRALASLKGLHPLEYRPEDITSLYHEDELVEETLTVFLQLLASAASNLAVTVGAQGGIYLAGGILPRIESFLQKGAFVERFCEKGVMSHYLENIPVQLVVHPNPALLGSAAYLYQKVK